MATILAGLGYNKGMLLRNCRFLYSLTLLTVSVGATTKPDAYVSKIANGVVWKQLGATTKAANTELTTALRNERLQITMMPSPPAGVNLESVLRNMARAQGAYYGKVFEAVRTAHTQIGVATEQIFGSTGRYYYAGLTIGDKGVLDKFDVKTKNALKTYMTKMNSELSLLRTLGPKLKNNMAFDLNWRAEGFRLTQLPSAQAPGNTPATSIPPTPFQVVSTFAAYPKASGQMGFICAMGYIPARPDGTVSMNLYPTNSTTSAYVEPTGGWSICAPTAIRANHQLVFDHYEGGNFQNRIILTLGTPAHPVPLTAAQKTLKALYLPSAVKKIVAEKVAAAQVSLNRRIENEMGRFATDPNVTQNNGFAQVARAFALYNAELFQTVKEIRTQRAEATNQLLTQEGTLANPSFVVGQDGNVVDTFESYLQSLITTGLSKVPVQFKKFTTSATKFKGFLNFDVLTRLDGVNMGPPAITHASHPNYPSTSVMPTPFQPISLLTKFARTPQPGSQGLVCVTGVVSKTPSTRVEMHMNPSVGGSITAAENLSMGGGPSGISILGGWWTCLPSDKRGNHEITVNHYEGSQFQKRVQLTMGASAYNPSDR